VPIAKRIGLGSVLGYLVAGAAIGPYGLGFVGEEGQDVMHFAEFGVVMMLFLVGLELQPSLLWRLRGPILGMGGAQVGITVAAVATLAMTLGQSWNTALVVGMILALSSTAIVLQSLNEKGLMQTQGGQSCFSVLLFQDIAVIPMLAVLPLLAIAGAGGGQAQETAHGSGISALPGWQQGLIVVGLIAAIIVAGRVVMRPVFRFIASTRLRETFTATALLLVICIALAMQMVGLSPALGTFLAGVVLAESEYRHELESDIEPFKGLLLGVFFLSVGASLDFDLVGAEPGMIAGLVAGLVGVKLAVLFVVGRLFKLSGPQNLLFSFSLAQGGEFAFVLFSFATQNGVLTADIANPLVAVVALSMAVTPVLMILNDRFLQPRFATSKEDREADTIDEENAVIIAGFGRFGNVVGRLLRANGVSTTVLDLDPDQIDTLRRFGIKVFYGDAGRMDLLQAAGAHKARLLILAIDDPEHANQIVEKVRHHFPDLHILARSESLEHSYELMHLGVEDIYRETLDSALAMGVDALRQLGFRGYQAHRAARIFRRHENGRSRELFDLWEDRAEYASRVREHLTQLDQHASPGVAGRWEGIDPAVTDSDAREELRLALSVFEMVEVHAPFAIVLDDETLPTALRRLEPVVEFAGDVGAAVVTVHAELPTSSKSQSAWAKRLAALDSRASESGLEIGLEVVAGFEVIRDWQLPSIGVTLDVGHMYDMEGGRFLEPFGSIGAVVKEIGDILQHLHVHDVAEVDHVEIGTGCVDFHDLVASLNAVGYAKGVCLEMNPNRVDPKGIVRSLEWLKGSPGMLPADS